jgi:hypothetical protein
MAIFPNWTWRWGTVLGVALPLTACSAPGGGGKPGTTTGHGGAPGTGGVGTGAIATSANGGGTGITITTMASTSSMDAGGHGCKSYDDAGNCTTCINIASIGHEGVWGPCSKDDTALFQNWLNTQSTAKVDSFDTMKPTLTAEFLAKYDVIILQWMVANGMQNNDGAPWQFSSEEVAALQDWVNKGGGIIALNGYQCPGNGCTIYDVTATNQLLSFTDIQFVADDILDPMGAGQPSCPDCYCWGGPLPAGAALGDGGTAAPGSCTWDQTSPIGAHVSALPAYVARSIKSTTASVDCSVGGTKSFAVHEQIGMGHVVAFGDEWVTYSGEWAGVSACLNLPYDSGYDPCYQKSAAQVFQIPQFWYNAIKYAASSVACFTIMQPGIIPTTT